MSGGDRAVPSLRGEVLIREPYLLEEDGADRSGRGPIREVVDVVGVGRHRVDETRLVVEASRSRLRVGRTDGTTCFIWGSDYTWTWEADGAVTVGPRNYNRVGSVVSALVTRRELDEWYGVDFTRPTGPPTARTFLDRPAWSVDLAPPARKGHPYPVTMVIDAVTGMVLSQRNDGFASVTEWTSLEVGVELDDGRFTSTTLPTETTSSD
jgi:hypothetical protein